jgi:hypothetical protein
LSDCLDTRKGGDTSGGAMISLLEKEARDPVEVLRVKLKDSTETSLLNSQLVRRLRGPGWSNEFLTLSVHHMVLCMTRVPR